VRKLTAAVVLGITPDLAFAAATVLLGLRRFPPCETFDVLIYHAGVPARDIELLSSLQPCRFVRYHCPESIRRSIPSHALRAFSDLVYAKYECFGLLSNYSYVIWLDADILIKGETKGLLDRGLGGVAFAREDKPLSFNFSKNIEGFDMDRPFFNTGVFVLSDRIEGCKEAEEWLMDATIRYADRIVMGEQGILNLWLQHHRIEPNNLLPDYNLFRHRSGTEHAKIIHAVGHHKPWMDFSDEAWNADYKFWLGMGGTACPMWKTVRFMARRHPHPLRRPKEMLPRTVQIGRFLARRNHLACTALRTV
jgi:lipopolysaccharide biosynthesis glycosyltransferase